MIEDFLATWPLFQHAWIAGWCIAAMLALLGVLVVARDQVFVGAAVAQASSLGVSVGLFLSGLGLTLGTPHDGHDHAHGGFGWPGSMSVIAGVVAAVVTSGAARGRGDRLTGWVFLASSSVGLLLLTRSPHGLAEIEHLMASSIIGADRIDQWLAFALLALTTIGVVLARSRLVLLAIDPAMADVVGMNRRAWEVAIAIWLGVCLGFGMRVVGTLYVFGCLVLPAMCARSICREVRTQYLVAPLVALVATATAFVAANHWDLPPAQAAVGLLCGAAAAASALRRVRALARRDR